MDVDMLVKRLNEIEQVIITSFEGLQGNIDLVVRRVKGMKEDRLNFSGFGVSDKENVTRLDMLNSCREAEMSKRGPTDEEIELENLGKDAEEWISEGIAEIRGGAGEEEQGISFKVEEGVTT